MSKSRNWRVGILVPSSNTTVEPDFWRLAPKGLTIHSARMAVQAGSFAALKAMEKDAEIGALMLRDADVDLICYACTSGSFYGGLEHEREIRAKLENISGVRVFTASEAAMKALKAFGTQKVAVGTPYPDDINETLVRFMEQSGMQVVKMVGLRIEQNLDVGRQNPSVAYKLGKNVDTEEADAIFLSCTNLRAAEVVQRLENELRKPVTCSSVATFWYAIRLLGYQRPIPGAGRLLSSPEFCTVA